MARNWTASESEETTDCSDESLLERRSYLKAAGLAVATVAGTGVASSSAAAADTTLDVSDGESIDSHLEGVSDGETVVIPSGTYQFSGATISASDFTVRGDGDVTFVTEGSSALRLPGDGWTVDGIRFDQQSGDMQVFPDGADWTIQNCAWTGKLAESNYLVYPQIDAGSTGTIDRCWFGDGVDRAESCIFTYSGTDGDLTVSRSYFYQSGVYGADTQSPPEQSGVVNFESCYFENCYNASCRTGMEGETATVSNCTVRYTSKEETPSSSWGGSGSSNVGGGSKSFRGVWAFWGDVVVEDCDIDVPYGPAVVTSSRHGSPSVTVRGGDVTGNPRTAGNVDLQDVGSDPSGEPPQECITSATEAVTGNGGSGSSSDADDGSAEGNGNGGSTETERTLTITGTGTVTRYAFSVDGAVSAPKDDIEKWDDLAEQGAEGYVTTSEHVDTYAFTGSVTEFSFETGEAELSLDGESVTPEELVSGSDGGSAATGDGAGASSAAAD